LKARNVESPSTPTKTAIKLELPGGGSSKATSIIDVDVELHVFDPNTATFLMQSPLATASIMKGNNYECILYAFVKDNFFFITNYFILDAQNLL
jgi:hypothetical protein